MSGLRLVARGLVMVLVSAAIAIAGTYAFYRVLPVVIGWFGLGRWIVIVLVAMVAVAEYRHRGGRAQT
jgi:hypothetical protein